MNPELAGDRIAINNWNFTALLSNPEELIDREQCLSWIKTLQVNDFEVVPDPSISLIVLRSLDESQAEPRQQSRWF